MIASLQLLARCLLAAVLVAAAASKLASPRSSQAALATFGLARDGTRWAAWATIIGVELALAAGVALGITAAAYAAAVLLAGFAAALAAALARGRRGAPCACFGSRSRVTWAGVGRNVVLAAAFAAVPSVPVFRLDAVGWLALGLAVALAAVAVLAVAMLALAREVGLLRLQLAPEAALEIPDEGPMLGARSELVERFRPGPAARFALAVFTSDGCHLCRALEPAVVALGRDPLVAVQVFDEHRDAEAWAAARVPGSPFAVAMELDGTVRAKGTFNSAAQLEGILAAAERRTRQEVGA